MKSAWMMYCESVIFNAAAISEMLGIKAESADK